MDSLLRALVTVASTSPAMASSMTFRTLWKAALPPSALTSHPERVHVLDEVELEHVDGARLSAPRRLTPPG